MTAKKPVLVKYVGPTQHTRIITVQDQINLGSDEDTANEVGDLVWDAAHGHVTNVAGIDAMVKVYFENTPEQFSFDVTAPGVAHLDSTGAPLPATGELDDEPVNDLAGEQGVPDATGTPNASSGTDSPS